MSLRLLRGLLFGALSLVALKGTAFAVGPEPTLLWPNGAPGAQGTEESDTPVIRVYLPEKEKATGAGVVICPGGGYGILATDHEGTQVAKWLNRNGIAGFVVRYRHSPKYRHPTPLQDTQRALRFVRANADKYGIAANRVGVLGFSAGGHLASTVATHFDAGNPNAADPVDRLSCRPSFAVLCYPVISFVAPFSHKGSGKNLIGNDATQEQLEALSNDRNVTKDTPPTFIFHTAEDPGVPVENALAFFSACRKHGVPAEMHVYQDGPHGVGLAPGDAAVGGWKDRLHDWLRQSAFLADVERAPVTGTISVGGKPMRWGMVTLVPKNPHAPRGWAMVSQGKFSIPASRGATVATNRVEIRNFGGVEPRPTIEDLEVLAGEDSKISFEVKTGANVLAVDLP